MAGRREAGGRPQAAGRCEAGGQRRAAGSKLPPAPPRGRRRQPQPAGGAAPSWGRPGSAGIGSEAAWGAAGWIPAPGTAAGRLPAPEAPAVPHGGPVAAPRARRCEGVG